MRARTFEGIDRGDGYACTDDSCDPDLCGSDCHCVHECIPHQPCSLEILTPDVYVCPGGTGVIEFRVTNDAPCGLIMTTTLSPDAGNLIDILAVNPSSLSHWYGPHQTLPDETLPPFTAEVTIDEASPFGTGTVKVSVENNLGLCSEVCDSGTVTVHVERVVDLDVDSNNDGSIDADNGPTGKDDPIETEFPGDWIWINNDDTDPNDGNPGPDNEDEIINGVEDLDDMIRMRIAGIDTALIPDGSTLTLTSSDPSVVRVFDGDVSASQPIIDETQGPTHTWAYADIPPPPSLFLPVEGLAPGSVTLTLALSDPDGNLICQDEVVVTVIGLEVQWYTSVAGQPGVLINDANEPDLDAQGNPVPGSAANVGYRYFPGATTQAGDWNKEVVVVVETDPPVGGVDLWLKAFDPDDPSYDGQPVDDNGPDGDDNRDQEGGMFGTLFEFSGTTAADGDQMGSLVVAFTTAVQPGDNHRVAATLKESAMDLLSELRPPPQLPQTQFQVPASNDEVQLFIGDLSPLLTAWRKLHVETDTMVRPTFAQNTWTMDWNEPREGGVTTQVEFDVDDPFSESPTFGRFQTQTGQFEQGFVELRDGAGNSLAVARVLQYASSEAGDDSVVINLPDCGGGLSGLACLGGAEFGNATFSDDDLGDAALFGAGIWGCDDLYAAGGTALLPPDLSALAYRYSPAYIEPLHETDVSGVGGLASFLRNVDFGLTANYGKVLWNQALPPLRNLPISTPQYWTVMVVSAWQAEQGEDKDPNNEPPTGGICTHPNGSTSAHVALGSSYTGMCAVFKAVKQLGAAESDIPEGFTVAHEIGHSLGLPHNWEIPLSGPLPDPEGLMDATGPGQNLPIVPENLKRLREYNGP